MTTQAEIADHLGITQPQVSEHQRRGLYPRGCTLNQARTAYIEHLREVAAGRGGDAQFRLTEQRARQAEADAQLKELQYWREVGALVAVAELEPLLADWAGIARGEVENAVDKAILDIERRHSITVDREEVDRLMESAFKAIAGFPQMNVKDESEGDEA